MDPRRWEQIESVYHAAIQRKPEERSAFLDNVCRGDDALRREVDSLLTQEPAVSRFLGAAAVAAAADLLSANLGSSMIGRQLGPYRVTGLLGAGGMGEVYRARDTRLGREVAIKVLPRAFTADSDRLGRFEREARILAALNHPYIATIHGVEELNGVRALVLELVDGPTLAERIEDGPLPIKEAIDIMRQIADALEAAHDKGIVHRDLKPANVKLTTEGRVKVLDFGLATASSNHGSAPDLSQAPTLAATAIGEAVMVGTPAYMSPEQARGQAVDKRTDIWGYGCILYELLTGRGAFSGATISDVIAAVLEREPKWEALPQGTPRAIEHLLKKCLEKDVRRRLRDVGDARIALEDWLSSPTPEEPALRPTAITRRAALTALSGAAVGAAVTGVFAISRYRGAVPRALTQFSIAMPEGEIHLASINNRIGISPNGLRVAFNTRDPSGIANLYTRDIGDLEPKRVKEIVNGIDPFFSPDGRWMGFALNGGNAIRKVGVSGGAPATIINTEYFGATWAADDTIYFVSAFPGGLMRVPAGGGTPAEAATIDFAHGERLHRFPQALPGGDAVLLTVATADSESFDDAQIAAFSVRTGQKKVLVEGGARPRYSPSGHLVYARNGNLLAVRFDPDRLEVNGQPVTVLENVLMSRNSGVANFDISASGDLAYIPGKAEGGARTLHWVDRSGAAEKLALPPRSYLHPRVSPDARKLAVEIEGSKHDIYVYDFASGVLSNITNDGVSHWPVWSPDGTRIGYRAGPMGHFRLWQVPADRSRAPERVAAEGTSQSLESYSPDGKAIAYTFALTLGGPTKMAVTPVQDSEQRQPLDNTRYAQGSPKFSPDGRWLAYCSNESGKPQVYVQAFPGPGAKIQISNDGGTDPVWKRNGSELFYRNGDSMMAVPVSTTAPFTAGRSHELWKGHYSHGMASSCGPAGLTSSNYDVTADGQRFLISTVPEGSTIPITVVLNWTAGLRK
jgi:serine/threonine protein kinase